mmetsp:Transcript_42888/g.52104  ORF Transcript_42888/g.52104 Transcript_42888/m.52104 type:complete len:211 (-) Transcript_42888:432-1064(-)|eukprot:CAMPEP_0172517296 /NCGR_PEP_ID=MMETSP1066-20121228/283848_1 /TAXON_ID=671091 /ORGANISM="Coscinodiscus wailesii, Strain CCMP2513" /LENGTH=210 /DNA_ID=CAMNT_0013299221 /DNA_START=149 /DNA_END=781 /DNA_ORIENTATION=-
MVCFSRRLLPFLDSAIVLILFLALIPSRLAFTPSAVYSCQHVSPNGAQPHHKIPLNRKSGTIATLYIATPSVFRAGRRRVTTVLNLVTEEEVLSAVERAETLWSEALSAREHANALSTLAEESSNSISSATSLAQSALDVKPGGTFGLSNIADVKEAMDQALDAGNKVEEAMEASQEADRLETLAEEALKASEKLLEQHLVDFPSGEDEK